jgi:hypothetical protein
MDEEPSSLDDWKTVLYAIEALTANSFAIRHLGRFFGQPIRRNNRTLGAHHSLVFDFEEKHQGRSHDVLHFDLQSPSLEFVNPAIEFLSNISGHPAAQWSQIRPDSGQSVDRIFDLGLRRNGSTIAIAALADDRGLRSGRLYRFNRPLHLRRLYHFPSLFFFGFLNRYARRQRSRQGNLYLLRQFPRLIA